MRLAPRGYEQAYGIWNGEDFLPVLEKELSLTEMSVSIYEVSALHQCISVHFVILEIRVHVWTYVVHNKTIIVCISVYLLTSYFQNALKTIADSGKEDEEDRRKGG